MGLPCHLWSWSNGRNSFIGSWAPIAPHPLSVRVVVQQVRKEVLGGNGCFKEAPQGRSLLCHGEKERKETPMALNPLLLVGWLNLDATHLTIKPLMFP